MATEGKRNKPAIRQFPGSVVSRPQAFAAAPESFRNLVNVICRTSLAAGVVDVEFLTDAFFVDISSVDVKEFDAKRLAADCDLVKKAALAHPKELMQLLTELQKGTQAGIDSSEALIKKLSLTEADFAKAGGGFLFLIAVVVVLAGSGCATTMKGGGGKPGSAKTTPSTGTGPPAPNPPTPPQ